MTVRSTFVLAALVLAWLAVGVLAVALANVVARLGRLEAGIGPGERGPYRRLRGRELGDLLPALGSPPPVRVVLLVSPGCRTCDRLMDDLVRAGPQPDLHVAWLGSTTPADRWVPDGASALPAGRDVADRLGVTLAPFAVAVDPDGRVLGGAPVGSGDDLDRLRAEHSTTPRTLHGGGR